MNIVGTEVPIAKYTGKDEKLFNDVNLVVSQLHSLQHQYFESWKSGVDRGDLLLSNAYDFSCKLLKGVLDSHKVLNKNQGDVIEEFEKIPYIKNFIETFDVYYTNLGAYHFSKDNSPCYYLNDALQMYDMQQKEVEVLHTLLSQALERLNKFEKTKDIGHLESLRWVLESL